MSVFDYAKKKTTILDKADSIRVHLLDLMNNFNIYKINYRDENATDRVEWVEIREPVKFFSDYESKYKFLYPSKDYFVWYRLFYYPSVPKRNNMTTLKKRMVISRDGNVCVKCYSTLNLTVDHIEPYLNSRNNTFYNLATLCRKCNCKKGCKPPSKNFIEEILIPHIKVCGNKIII